MGQRKWKHEKWYLNHFEVISVNGWFNETLLPLKIVLSFDKKVFANLDLSESLADKRRCNCENTDSFQSIRDDLQFSIIEMLFK